MPSYTIQVVYIQPTHESSNKKYLSGDIVGIHPLITDSPNKNGRLCLLHIKDAPNDINLTNFLAEFVRVEYSESDEIESKSAWSVDLSSLTGLEGTRQCDVSWDVAKVISVRKEDGMTGGEYYEGLNK